MRPARTAGSPRGSAPRPTFAAELRASAGLPPAAAAAAQPGPAGRTSLLAAVRASAGQVGADPRIRAVGRALRELAPIWWLARAYVAVIVVTRIAGAGWSFSHPAITRFGHLHVVALFLVAAAIGSVAVGLRRRGRPLGRAAIVVNVLLALASVPSRHPLRRCRHGRGPTRTRSSTRSGDHPGLSLNGRAISNIYPYTRDGRLLHDVLLFDSAGRPLDVNRGDPDPARRVLLAGDGQRIFDSFPIRYFNPGTRRVSKPNAAPALAAPSLFTLPAHR